MRSKEKDHERYVRNREKILAAQKLYRETHKEQIKARRRERNYIRVYLTPRQKEVKSRSVYDHEYYERHKDEIREKRKRYYEENRNTISEKRKRIRLEKLNQ